MLSRSLFFASGAYAPESDFIGNKAERAAVSFSALAQGPKSVYEDVISKLSPAGTAELSPGR
jgi:hypothetical protein